MEETTRERNTQRVKKYLRHQFNEKGTSSLNFNQLMVEESHSRSNIARMFYHVLVLGTVQDIAVQQARPYGDILISKKVPHLAHQPLAAAAVANRGFNAVFIGFLRRGVSVA